MLPRASLTVPRRRVVVTGLGLVTPLGTGVKHVWRQLIAGGCGVKALDFGEQHVCKVGAPVPQGTKDGEFDASLWIQDRRTQDSGFVSFALSAADQALADAEWPPGDVRFDEERTGVALGGGIGCIADLAAGSSTVETRGVRRLSPFFVPRILINMAAGHVSIRHGLRGPNHACVTACASGAHDIGDASRLVERGDADVMVAGASESTLHPLAFAGFSRLKALATRWNDDPTRASRPFDRERAGFVMGEGAGALVLEELDHARARGARIYAELRGYGLSGDAHHITAPAEDGRGAVTCMRAALKNASLRPEHVDYCNAHATSTPLGDAVELRALTQVFGCKESRARRAAASRLPLAVSSTKGHLGHLLAGCPKY